MKAQVLLATVAALALASCRCNTTDDAAMQAGGNGAGYQDAQNQSPTSAMTAASPMGDTVDRVFFAFDKYSLTDEGKQTLKSHVAWLQDHPQTPVLVAGNCDERGTREYNIGLGERRASAVRDFLVSQGVNPQRITVTSYGKDRPSVPGSNEEAWAQNRNAITIPQ